MGEQTGHCCVRGAAEERSGRIEALDHVDGILLPLSVYLLKFISGEILWENEACCDVQ